MCVSVCVSASVSAFACLRLLDCVFHISSTHVYAWICACVIDDVCVLI